MRILLTGGTGLIGRALCHYWKTQGHDLIIWTRRPWEVPTLCSHARGISELQELDNTQTLDAVINLAGAPIADQRWTTARRQLLWNSRVDLTRKLVDWLATLAKPPKVLLSGSATGWYGDGGDRQLDEDSPPGNQDFGSRLCIAWEQEAQRAQALGMRVILLRTAPVLAPEGGMLARLRLLFSLGLGGRLGNGQQWMPWIHLADEVGLIDFLLQHDDCSGIFNACAPQQVRNAEFTQALAHTLHHPARLPVPAWLLQLAMGEMSVLLLGGQRLYPRYALEKGYQFHFPELDNALAKQIGRPG
ncbi:TIGR01777 family oxidoreductase [Nitrosomonas sp.]|uniref:TIGR01777 family oxidoreductase n=1 Tax=Nitrosomonas sp. TaxID=42353 RepID=UPI0025EBDC00|nr:TIGR01777 family oxidoreductase [Nitrosomonas sp.]